MSKLFKKTLSMIMVLMLIVGLTACGSSDDNQTSDTPSGDNSGTTTDDSNDATDDTDTPVEPEPEDEAITLDVWHLWTTENDGNAVSFNKALEMYKADHPNVTINIDATENEAYKTKIKTAISANEAPDVFFSWGAGFSKPFVDAGAVLPLEDYLPEGQLANLNRTSTNNFTYDDTLYGLPFISWLGVLYCNEELFEAEGLKIPETMDELMTAVDTFNAKGVVPITVGAKDAWTAQLIHNMATVRTAGTELSTQALMKEASYDQEGFIEGARIVSDLVAANAFDPSALAFTYDEAKIGFLNGTNPMIYMGSWLAGEIQNPDLSMVKDKVIAVKFPEVEGSAHNNEFLGGAIDGLMVNANTEHKEAAAEFVAYITEKMARESFLQGAGIPTYTVDVSGEEIDPLVQQIVDLADKSEGYVVAWDTFLSGADVTTHLSLVQELFAGTKTPEEFAQGMQALNE